eukprot:864880-Rhodomonas_salina.2
MSLSLGEREREVENLQRDLAHQQHVMADHAVLLSDGKAVNSVGVGTGDEAIMAERGQVTLAGAKEAYPRARSAGSGVIGDDSDSSDNVGHEQNTVGGSEITGDFAKLARENAILRLYLKQREDDLDSLTDTLRQYAGAANIEAVAETVEAEVWSIICLRACCAVVSGTDIACGA